MTEVKLQIHVLFMDRVDCSTSGTKETSYFHAKKKRYNTQKRKRMKEKYEKNNI